MGMNNANFSGVGNANQNQRSTASQRQSGILAGGQPVAQQNPLQALDGTEDQINQRNVDDVVRGGFQGYLGRAATQDDFKHYQIEHNEKGRSNINILGEILQSKEASQYFTKISKYADE